MVNPFTGRLTFADTGARTRRDHGKYSGLVAVVTLIEVAHRLAHAFLGRATDDWAPRPGAC